MNIKRKIMNLNTNEIALVSGAGCDCYKDGQLLRGQSAKDFKECWLKCCEWENDKNYDTAIYSYDVNGKKTSDSYSCKEKPFKENIGQKAEGAFKSIKF